jgi:hypothetical protein
MDKEKNVCLTEKKKGFRFRPTVYICSPYRGDVEKNTERARRYSALAVERKAIPYAPHLLFPQFMHEKTDRDRLLALFMGQVMLDKCAEVWVFGENITEGMKGEIERAQMRKKVIRYFTENGKEVKANE